MSKYQRKYGVNMVGLSREEHRACGKATCPACGAEVSTNQEGKLWVHDVAGKQIGVGGGLCLAGSWKRPEEVRKA